MYPMDHIRHHLRDKYKIIGLMLFSLLWALVVLWPHVFDPYRVPIDAQNHYWMAKFQDLSLFEHDLLPYADDLIETSVFGVPIILYPRSVGYAILFWVGSFLISPIWLGKVLVFFLLPVSVFITYQLGKRIRDKGFGLYMAGLYIFFNLALPDSLSSASGLQRSFALPLFLLFLHFLHLGKDWIASIVIVSGALFYLPTVPVMGLTFLLNRLVKTKSQKSLVKTWLPFLLGLIVSLAAAAWALSITFDFNSAALEPRQIQYGSIFEDPRYQSGGAAPMYLNFPWIGRAGFFESYPEAVILLVIVIMYAILELITSENLLKEVPPVLWHFLIAGGGMYVLSLVTLLTLSSPMLYMPSRYLRYPLLISSIYLLTLSCDLQSGDIKKAYRPGQPWQFFVRLGLLLITIALLSGVFFGFQMPDWLGWFMLVTAGIAVLGNLLVGIRFMARIKWPQYDFSAWFSKPGLLATLYAGTTLLGVFAYSRLVGYGTINPSPDVRNLYSFVEHLPKDVLIAGSPEELTGIPLFARRKVLFRDLRPRRDAPVIENFRAYYASDWDTVRQFCRQYSVDYFLYNTEDYSSTYLEEEQFFYQPYNEIIKGEINPEPPFVLPVREDVYSTGSLGLVRCD